MVMLIGPALPWTKYADTTVTGADVPEASSWPGEPARPAGAPDLRASDADRDRVVAVIRAAVGDGRRARAAVDPRRGGGLTAQAIGDLAALIADLDPGPAHPARIVPEVS